MGVNDKTFRAYPGGYVVSFIRQGDLILVVTATPNTTGYDLQGRPRRHTRLPNTTPLTPDWRRGKVVMVGVDKIVTVFDGTTEFILW